MHLGASTIDFHSKSDVLLITESASLGQISAQTSVRFGSGDLVEQHYEITATFSGKSSHAVAIPVKGGINVQAYGQSVDIDAFPAAPVIVTQDNFG